MTGVLDVTQYAADESLADTFMVRHLVPELVRVMLNNGTGPSSEWRRVMAEHGTRATIPTYVTACSP